MSEYKLECLRISACIQGKKVLSDVSIGLSKGEFLTVTGPSGAGKSMFLRTLNRLQEPHSGVVKLDGVDIQNIDPRELRKRVGMLFQLPAIFEGTVAKNISMGIRYNHKCSQMDRPRLKAIIAKAATDAGLNSSFLLKDANRLSVGEQQRVCLARALLCKPEVLLLDEPTASLDPASEIVIETTLSSLNQLGMTIIMVTHKLEQATRLGSKMLRIENGRGTWLGKPEVYLAEIQIDLKRPSNKKKGERNR